MRVQSLFETDFIPADVDPRFEIDDTAEEEHGCVTLTDRFPSGVTGSEARMDSLRLVEPLTSDGVLRSVSCRHGTSWDELEGSDSESVYISPASASVHIGEGPSGSTKPCVDHRVLQGRQPLLDRSCLKGSHTESRRRNLNVRFSFEVQFWFPAPSQTALPPPADDAWHVAPVMPGGPNAAIVARHVGFRPPNFEDSSSSLRALSASSILEAPHESAKHFGFRPPTTSSDNAVLGQVPFEASTWHVGLRPSMQTPGVLCLGHEMCHPVELCPSPHATFDLAVGNTPPASSECFSSTPSHQNEAGCCAAISRSYEPQRATVGFSLASLAGADSAMHVGPCQPTAHCMDSQEEELHVFEDSVSENLTSPPDSALHLLPIDPYKGGSCRTLADITAKFGNPYAQPHASRHSSGYQDKDLDVWQLTSDNSAAPLHVVDQWPPLRPHAKSQPERLGSVEHVEKSSAQWKGFRDTSASLALHAPPAEAQVAVAETCDTCDLDPYSSFDAVQGLRVLNGQVGWQEHHYVSHAIDTAGLPGNPIGRVMRVETACHPSPQVILTQDHGGAFYRAVLFGLGDVGGPLQVVDVTPMHTVDIALREVLPPHDWEQLHEDLLQGRALSFVNRLPADAFVAISHNADIVHVIRTAAVATQESTDGDAIGPVSRRPPSLPSYTVFCVHSGIRLRPRPASSTVQDCIFDAVQRSGHRAFCLGGTAIKCPIAGYPTPQIVLHYSQPDTAKSTCLLDVRPVGSCVRVLELPVCRPIAALCVGNGPLASTFCTEGLCPSLLRVFVDGVLRTFSSHIGARAQVLTFRPRADPIMRGIDLESFDHRDGAGPPDNGAVCSRVDVGAPAEAGRSSRRPPTPPVPDPDLVLSGASSSRWGSGTRWDHSCYAPLQPPAPSCSSRG